MDDRSFDRLARTVATGSSRRAVAKAMLGSAIGGILAVAGTFGRRDAAAACKAYLQTCLANADCCTG